MLERVATPEVESLHSFFTLLDPPNNKKGEAGVVVVVYHKK